MSLPLLQGLPVSAVLRRLWREAVHDDLLDRAAQMSFYFIFSLFPLLFFLVTLTAYLPLRGAMMDLLARVGDLMPASAFAIVHDQLDALLGQPRPRLLTLGLLVTLWSASRGVDAMRACLNGAYDVVESRSFARAQLTSIGATVLATLLIPLSFAMIVAGGDAGAWLAAKVGLGPAFHFVWSWVRWPLTAVVLMMLLSVLYHALPDVRQKFRFVTPGAVFANLAWLGATWLFTKYAENFGNFDVTYGAIGGVVALLTWLYISSLVFIVGGEINAVVEQAAAEQAAGARRGRPPPVRQKGPRPPPPDEEARARERLPRAARARVGTEPGAVVPPSREAPH